MTHARGYYHGLAKAGIFGQWSPNTFVDQTPNSSSPKALSSSLQKGMKEREWLSPAVITTRIRPSSSSSKSQDKKGANNWELETWPGPALPFTNLRNCDLVN